MKCMESGDEMRKKVLMKHLGNRENVSSICMYSRVGIIIVYILGMYSIFKKFMVKRRRGQGSKEIWTALLSFKSPRLILA